VKKRLESEKMTARELMEAAGQHSIYLIIYFAALPALALVLGYIHGPNKGSLSPWKYIYSFLVFGACIPGILAAVITGYILFLTRENLLDFNLLVYVLPIIVMLVTLVLISRNVSFEEVPGFHRLSGLIATMAVTFALVMLIEKTRIWVVFFGSVYTLIGLTIGLYALLKWSVHMLFVRREGQPLNPPK
jgi:hypothetical protein